MSVTAPPQVQAQLLDVAAFDTELQRIATAKRGADAAKALSAAGAERDRIRRQVGDLRGVRDDLRTELRRIESDVAVVEQRLARDRSRLATTASPKDAQGLEQEIATLLRRQSALEDTQLELMERVESAEQAAADAETELTARDAEVAALRATRDETLAGLTVAEQSITADRAALIATLPDDLVTLYERQRTRYGVGAALLRRGVSGGSNMALTGADLAAVRAAAPDAVVLDPESGCILVRTDESGI